MDDDWDHFPHDEEDEGGQEAIGCCDNCDCNLYEDDCYIHGNEELCGQCYWWRTMA